MADRPHAADRRARAARIRDQHQHAERRRSLLIIGPAVLVAALLIGSTIFVVVERQREDTRVAEAAQRPIDGVQDFKDLSRNHVTTPVEYPQRPSVGGDHSPTWANCGFYSEAVEPTLATHSLEHGAVWIGYDPALRQPDVDALEQIARANSFVLVSPVEGLAAPVTASAWGKQLALDNVEDERLSAFVQKYQQGPQTPEPGAPCSGGGAM